MGCGGSKQDVQQPQPIENNIKPVSEPPKPVSNGTTPNQEVKDEQEEEEEETGSDCLYISTDPGEETLEVDDSLEEYNHIKPSEEAQENHIKKATNVKFFEDWFPEYFQDTDADSESRPRTVNHIDIKVHGSDKQLTIADIDKRARETPQDKATSFKALRNYLLKDLEKQTDKDRLAVRAILVWLSIQEEGNFGSKAANKDSPEGFLSLLAKKQTLFSTFFTVLCREFGLTCVKIKGFSKAGDYQPGDAITKENSSDNWTAVYFENSWNIVHPYWVCRGLFGHRPAGWIKLEAGGKTIGKSEKGAAGVLRNAFKEYYIFPNPKEFIHTSYPIDSKWQLTKNPISLKRFEKMPYLLPTFFGMGLKLISDETCLLNTIKGECMIEMQAPLKNANQIGLWYELYLKEGTGKTDDEKRMLQKENIPKLVAMIRCGDLWQFKLSLPIEGTFKICCYGGPYKSSLARIAEFRVDCKERKKDCRILPFDPGRVGFGPGPAAASAGFFLPSHAGGLVPVNAKSTIEISFTVEKIVIERTTIRATLYTTNKDQTVLQENVSVRTSVETSTVYFDAEVPDEGEYALSINTVRQSQTTQTTQTSTAVSNGKSQQHVREETSNVCNYLLSTFAKSKEKLNQKLARSELQSSLESAPKHGEGLAKGIKNIENGIKKCLKQKIMSSDNQIVVAKSKLEHLRIKNEVRNAKLRRNLYVTMGTIHMIKNSSLSRICDKEIQELEEFKMELEQLQKFPQEPPSLHWAIGELANSHTLWDEINNTVKAFLTLLGEPPESLKTWNDMLNVLRPPADMPPMLSLTARIKEMETSGAPKEGVDLENVTKCLKTYSIDQVRNINVGAAVMYEWVLKNSGQKTEK